jgi:hypothetical protein
MVNVQFATMTYVIYIVRLPYSSKVTKACPKRATVVSRNVNQMTTPREKRVALTRSVANVVRRAGTIYSPPQR